MRKVWAERAFTVTLVVLSHNRNDRHGDPYEAVVVDADPDDVEPGEAALGCSPRAPVSSTYVLEPAHWQDPRLNGSHLPEKLLLLVQVRRHVLTHELKEGRDSKGLIAV